MDLEEFTNGKLGEYSYMQDPDAGDPAKLAPASSEISRGALSTHIARRLRQVHRDANVYRMAIALIEEEKALASFREEYGEACESGSEEGFEEFIKRVRNVRSESEQDDVSFSEIEELLKPILGSSGDSEQSQDKNWAKEEPAR